MSLHSAPHGERETGCVLGAEEVEASGAGGKIATSEVTKLYSAFSTMFHFHFSISTLTFFL